MPNVVALKADDHRNSDEMLCTRWRFTNNNVRRGTELALNEVYIGRYLRLPMTILEGRGVEGHQGLNQNQTNYLELMTDRQVLAYNQANKKDKMIKAKDEAAHERLNSILHRRPKFEVAGWAWVYDNHSIVTGGGTHMITQ